MTRAISPSPTQKATQKAPRAPARIWIDPVHGQHPGDWTFYTERVLIEKDHRKAGRLAYVPEDADAVGKWQAKAQERKNEIGRLLRRIEDSDRKLREIQRERDAFKDFAREVRAAAQEGTLVSDSERIGQKAHVLLESAVPKRPLAGAEK